MLLTPKQEKFCLLYHQSGNAIQSYIEAYGVKYETANRIAYRLLRNPAVQERLQELYDEAGEIAKVDKSEIIERWLEVISTPIGEIDETHPLAQEVTYRFDKQGNETGKTVKMPSKADGFKELARLIGAYEPDKVEHGVADELAELLKEIRER